MTERDAWGSWEADRERKYLVGLEMTAAEIEEMLVLAFASGALPKPRDEWGQPLDGDE